MEELKIVYLPPGDLTPYEHNAKAHPDKQVEQIANSIREFGFRQPIVVDGDNIVVIGHGRLLAAKLLGLGEVPVVRADDLSEAQIKALRLADNKTNESEWDFAELEAELAELELDFDMADFGFGDIGGVSDEGYTDDFTLKDGDREPVQNMTFTFSDSEADVIKEAISVMKGTQRFRDYENPENMNGNGNALFLVVEEWLRQRI